MAQRSYTKTTYLKSVVDLADLPEDSGGEVAFIGRSNAGKSSAINSIAGIKGLCRTSKTPGRTQMINLFCINDQDRLVDLPGYGYARVPRHVMQRWSETIEGYLESRHCLRGLVLVMDIRHPLKDSDQNMLAWCVSCGIPVHILLTKSDKLKYSQAKQMMQKVKHQLREYGDVLSVQLFSSLSKEGIEEAKGKLEQWYSNNME